MDHGGDVVDQFLSAFGDGGAHEEYVVASFLHFVFKLLDLLGVSLVDLVADHDLGTGLEERVELAEFFVDLIEVGDRVSAVLSGDVDDVDQKAGALNVAEEVVAEAVAFAGALNEARDIGDNKAGVTDADDAEHGLEGREGIVRDFRFCRGDHGEQCGLAGVREADETYVCDEFEFYGNVQFFTGHAGSGELRCLADGVTEVDIALTAAAALGNDLLLSFFREIGNDFAGLEVLEDGADRYADAQILATFSVHFPVHAVAAVLGDKLVLEAEVLERGQFLSGVEDHVAAFATVAAVRAAVRDKFLCVKRYHSVTAVAGFDVDFRVIDKHDTAPVLS